MRTDFSTLGRSRLLAAIVTGGALLGGCSGGDGSPSPRVTPTAKATASPTPAATATPAVTPTPTAVPTTTPTAAPTATPVVVAPTSLQFNATNVTTAVAVTGPASTNYNAMTVTSSNTAVATAVLTGNNRQFNVTSVGAGSATITVVPSDGSAGPATLSVQVQTTTFNPNSRHAAQGATL